MHWHHNHTAHNHLTYGLCLVEKTLLGLDMFRHQELNLVSVLLCHVKLLCRQCQVLPCG